MLYRKATKSLDEVLNSGSFFYGEGRSETGICLHLPFNNKHTAGGIPAEDHAFMIELANNLIDYLMNKRPVRGPENWDYDGDKAGESYRVCGDNPVTSGIVIFDTNYKDGPKLQVSIDKTFGANEIAVRWKDHVVPYGQENVLQDYMEYLRQAVQSRELSSSQT